MIGACKACGSALHECECGPIHACPYGRCDACECRKPFERDQQLALFERDQQLALFEREALKARGLDRLDSLGRTPRERARLLTTDERRYVRAAVETIAAFERGRSDRHGASCACFRCHVARNAVPA